MVWKIELQRVVSLLATVVVSSVLLSGCLAESSRTELDWTPASDPIHHPRVAENAPHRTPHHQPSPVHQAALNCPTPNSTRPGWYSASNLPPPAAPTTEPATYSPGTLAFAWPVTGPIISDFGTNGSGARNDGINIATPYGTPIHAAAAGQISYAGNELKGYGNLILIKHDDGYVTAYAHADRLIVNRGDYVAKGQVIGYAGQTGDVTSPQLHFEIRKGVQPINPRSVLIASRAS